MRAMILAAGFGTRLQPLTQTMPKALVPVAGRPLIEYSLLFLRSQGITEVVINLHHLGEAIRATLGDGSRCGMQIFYSPEDPILEAGGGIKNAQPLLDGETFIVLNCDTILDLDLYAALAFHRHHRAAVTLILRPDAEVEQYGVLETNAQGQIRRIRDHVLVSNEERTRYMFTGLQILEPRIFDFMPDVRPFSTTRETYPRMMHAGEALYGFVHTGPWMVVDDEAGRTRATQAIASGQVQLSYLRP
ncbi:MAG: NDP-sugar synthase [Deltaproteobacteria bacterium]|nr:NDP-sugar synthase [Deltaproteobacteria bacterium]